VTTYPATYTVSGLAACPRFGATAKTYRRGTVAIDQGGTTVRKSFPSDATFCRKPPTKKQAKAAVAAYVRTHRHVATVTVTCDALRDVDRECTARWRSGGKARRGTFDVSAGAKGRVDVQPFG